MTPGYYIVRKPGLSTLKVESICFKPTPYGKHNAINWREFIAQRHPKDEVYLMEILDV